MSPHLSETVDPRLRVGDECTSVRFPTEDGRVQPMLVPIERDGDGQAFFVWPHDGRREALPESHVYRLYFA